MPSPGEEVDQGPSQLPGVGIEAGYDSLPDSGDHRGVFGGEPVDRLFVAGEMFGDGAGWARRQGYRVALWIEQQGGTMTGVQVMIELAVQGGAALGLAVVDVG